MLCPDCGHHNHCPSCNSYLCEVCGAEMPPPIPDENDYGYVQYLNEGANQNDKS